jgi:ribosomal protein S18 acetylase RimI-like enzyme
MSSSAPNLAGFASLRRPLMSNLRRQNMHIRPLTASDALGYRELMLEAYVLAPDAFTTTAEERANEPESWWVRRIGHPQGLQVSFAADMENWLVGTVALEYGAKSKTRHGALLIGMYVRQHARGKGVGRLLLDAALSHASARAGVQVVTLTVTEGNQHAIGLYERAGFVAWGTQPLAIATPSGLKGKVHMSHTLSKASAR